jgi:hypothetical protein
MISKVVAIVSLLLLACSGWALAQSPATAPATAVVSLNQSRTPHRKPVPGVIEEMTTKELGNFDYDEEKGGTIPADVVALNGTTIRLRGFMVPTEPSDIKEFLLVDDLFAPWPPPIQQTIVVHLREGKAVKYFPEMITVEGKLHVRVQRDQGDIVSIFDLDATSVHPAAPVASRGPSTQPR